MVTTPRSEGLNADIFVDDEVGERGGQGKRDLYNQLRGAGY